MTGRALQPRLTEKHRIGLYGKGKKKIKGKLRLGWEGMRRWLRE